MVNLHNFSQTWLARVLWTRDQVTFRNAEIGFEDGKGESLRQQKPVRDLSRSGACQLARAWQVGSISPSSESNSEGQPTLR